MTEPKEFESLDELFRKTFDNLPEKPAASGWDTPSGRVWQHVQKQIRPPQSGWSTQTLTLIAAFAVTLALGLYLYLGRPESRPATLPLPVAESAEQPAAASDEPIANTPVAQPESTVFPAQPSRKKPAATSQHIGANAAPNDITKHQAAKTGGDESAVGRSGKPDDKKTVSPNTTERRKAELARRATEAWKKPLQLLPQRWPGKTGKPQK